MPSAVWKGYLSFGLVSIPVRLFAAARSKTTRFHLLHNKDLSRVYEVFYCSAEDKPLERSELVKGFEVSKDDPLFFEKSYYVVPQENADKPYNLLRAAMSDGRTCAIGKFSMHGRENTVIIRYTGDGLVLHTMYYADELNGASRMHSRSRQVNRKELGLARKLMQSLTAPFKPEQFHDEYRQNIERLIAQKRKGEPVTRTQRPKHAPVIDIAEALRKSLSENEQTRSKQRGSGKKHRVA